MDKNLKSSFRPPLTGDGSKLKIDRSDGSPTNTYGINKETDRMADNCAQLDHAINTLIERINFILRPREAASTPPIDRSVSGSMYLVRLVELNDRLEANIMLLHEIVQNIDN